MIKIGASFIIKIQFVIDHLRLRQAKFHHKIHPITSLDFRLDNQSNLFSASESARAY